VWVRRSIGLGGAKKPKSRKSVRAIALVPTLATELEALWKETKFKSDADPVFASEHGTPLDGRNMIRVVFAPALKRSGLPRMRFHDLRHTFASLLIAQGAHVKYISEQLGHASVQITLDRYGHLFDQSYADESAKLEKALADALDSMSAPALTGADQAYAEEHKDATEHRPTETVPEPTNHGDNESEDEGPSPWSRVSKGLETGLETSVHPSDSSSTASGLQADRVQIAAEAFQTNGNGSHEIPAKVAD
jgi:hypothetical protein